MKTQWKVLTVLAFLAILTLSTAYLPTLASQAEQTGPTTAVPADQPTVEVEPALTERFINGGNSGYLIYFRAAPDLAAADNMSWEDRGWFVMKELQATAEASQGNVRAYLDSQNVQYQSFWIDNIIAVENSSRNTLNGLLTFSEIEIIRAPRLMSVMEPEESVNSVNAANAVEPNLVHILAPNAWADGYRGEGMVVANIDTGVRYTHEALVRQYRGTSSGSHNYNWLGAAGGNSAPTDDNGHGTHTMGTIVGENAAVTNQTGVAPGAQWIACDACQGSGCPDAALLTCAQWVAAPYPIGSPGSPNPSMRPNVVNNSWGDCGQTYDNWFEASITAWHAAGIYPVFSNGNASNCGYSAPPGLNTVGNPARSGNVTGVGSSGTSNGLYATHSNWGPTDNLDTVNPQPGWANLKPQVLAPGVSIRSSTPGSDTEYQSSGWSGTSMSAPHVTGLVALMMQAGSCLVGNYAATETIIENTATPIYYNDGSGARWPNYATGWGEINVEAAVTAASLACGPDFKIEAAPAELAICAPNDAVFNVTVDHLGGFNGTVAFTADVPAGTSASFAPTSVVTPTTQSVLTIDTTGATAGSYTVVITGTSVPTPTHSTAVGLDVYTVSPVATTLTAPANNAVDVPLMPTFSWTAVAQAADYYLEVATDAAFTNIVYTATESGTSHTMTSTNLDAQTLYYWRVSVANACGTSTYSPVYSFTSVLLLCSTPNKPIPDNTTITDALTSSRNEPLSDINVSVRINHTWIGDLDINLTHQETGSQAELLPVSFTCSYDNIDATFDDESANPITCNNSNPSISGDVKPSGNLGVFDYEALAGTWQIAVHDSASGDSGTLVEWCLEPTFATGIGVVAGTVTDANTTNPLAGAAITFNDGMNVYNALTNGAGEYNRSLGSGTYTVTAVLANYSTAQAAGIAVTDGVTTTQNFVLDAGQLNSDAADFAATLDLATSTTLPWNLANTGAAAANYDIRIVDNGYSPNAMPQAGEDVLVVAVDTTMATAMETALTSLGYTYLRVTATVFQGMTVPDLLTYKAVFHAGNATPVATQNKVIAYLDAGGSFYISDNDFGYFNGSTTLYQQYLQSTYISDNGSKGVLIGQDFMSGINPNVNTDPYPDDFTVGAEGVEIFKAPSGKSAGVAVDRLGYKAVYTSFDFQYIAGVANQEAVMAEIANFLMNTDSFWLSTDIETGTLAVGADQDIVVTMDANMVALAGKYYANLVVRNNTPYGDLVLPVTMTVECPTCGTLAGDITDAFTSAPLVAAVQITNTSSFDYTINGSNYSIDLPPDTYYLSVTAPGYLSETTTAVVTQGITTTTDFALTPAFANLVYSPPEIEEYMNIGDMVTNTVTVTNTGTIDLDFDVSIGNFGGPSLQLHLVDISIPRFEGELPESKTPITMDRAPQTSGQVNQSQVQPLALLGEMAYALDLYPGENLVNFPNVDAPGAWTVIGSVPGFYPAGDFLGNDFSKIYAMDGDTDQLVSIDTTTRTRTVIGSAVGNGSWSGMTGAVDGKLYVSSSDCSTSSTLYTINPTTAALTLIGPIDSGSCIIDIAINAAGDLYGVDLISANLIKINTTTGAGTVVGSLGASPNYAQGMDFEQVSGVLYWAAYTTSGEMRIIDTTTGASSLVGAFPGGAEVDALSFATFPGGTGSWASAAPTSGTIPPGGSATFDVVFDATSLFQVGDYTADLNFSGNFNNVVPTMPLTMHINCPTCGILDGDITDFVTGDPLVADINITGPGNFDVTLTDSSYQLAVADGPYTITVSANGYLGDSAAVTAVTGNTTTTDFALRPAAASISVDPQLFNVTLVLGDTATYSLDINNSGFVPTAFELREQDGGFMPAFVAQTVSASIDTSLQTPLLSTAAISERGVVAGETAVIAPAANGIAPTDIGTSWETMAPLPSARVFNAVIADQNGYVYVFGGTSDAAALTPTNTTYRYDVATNTWDTMASMPVALDSMDGALVGNKIYIPGGATTATTYVYDIGTDSWSSISASGGYTARSQYQVVVMGTNLYVLGGIVASASASTTEVWVLDTVTGTWAAGTPMQKSRTSFAAASVNGEIVVAGGVLFPGFTPDMTTERFNGATWSYGANVPNGGGAYTRWSYMADGQTEDGLWLAAGRRDAGWLVLNHAGYYAPATDTWTDSPTIPTLAQERVYMEGAVASDGYFYVIGGRDSAGAVAYATNERLLVADPASSDVIWLATDPITGTVAAETTTSVDVIFDTTVLTQTGIYNAVLKVLTNDPMNSTINVPITLTVTAVVPVYGVDLTPATDAKSDAPGKVVTYMLTLTNSGDTADTFNLTAGTSTFATTLSTSLVALAAGASTTVEVYVTIPANAADGASAAVTVTATSQGDPSESAASTLTTTAVWLKVYLPVIMK